MASNPKITSQRWIALAVAVLFFFTSLILVNDNQLFISPDETANAYSAQVLADTGSMVGEHDGLTELTGDRIHPRSMVAVDGQLYPGSFLGLPVIYGLLAAIFGSWILLLLTPAITLGAGLAWRKLIETFFGAKIGFIAFVLFLLHPAIWYYSARGLMHNVLFIDLVVLALWLWFTQPLAKLKKAPWLSDTLAGLSLGLALFVRTSEFGWVLLSLLALTIFFFKKLSLKRVAVALLGLAIGLGILFAANALTYGGPLTTGYTVGVDAAQVVLSADESVDTVKLFPFGIHPASAWGHFSVYFGSMFWWLTTLAAIGLGIVCWRDRKNRIKWGILATGAIIFVYLTLMYGSWEIHDNPDPTQITMANSYVRYWLPMYILSIPLIAIALDKLALTISSKKTKLISAGLLIIVVILNFNAVFSQGQDGLLKVADTLSRSGEIQTSILEHTPDESVIIVDRADKLIFPHRQVWYPLRDDTTYSALPLLTDATSVYYYGITFPPEDMEYLNASRLGVMNLGIELVETYDLESLYYIYKK